MRTPLLAFAAFIAAGALAPTPAHAAVVDPLQVSTTQTHVGEAFTVTGNFCSNAGPAPTITYTTQTAFPKAPIMTLPLSNESVSLAQTPTGFTFTYTPPTAKTWVWFGLAAAAHGQYVDTQSRCVQCHLNAPLQSDFCSTPPGTPPMQCLSTTVFRPQVRRVPASAMARVRDRSSPVVMKLAEPTRKAAISMSE